MFPTPISESNSESGISINVRCGTIVIVIFIILYTFLYQIIVQYKNYFCYRFYSLSVVAIIGLRDTLNLDVPIPNVFSIKTSSYLLVEFDLDRTSSYGALNQMHH